VSSEREYHNVSHSKSSSVHQGVQSSRHPRGGGWKASGPGCPRERNPSQLHRQMALSALHIRCRGFQGNGNVYTHEAKVAELERIIGLMTPPAASIAASVVSSGSTISTLYHCLAKVSQSDQVRISSISELVRLEAASARGPSLDQTQPPDRRCSKSKSRRRCNVHRQTLRRLNTLIPYKLNKIGDPAGVAPFIVVPRHDLDQIADGDCIDRRKNRRVRASLEIG
jgi:hypothetical protein